MREETHVEVRSPRVEVSRAPSFSRSHPCRTQVTRPASTGVGLLMTRGRDRSWCHTIQTSRGLLYLV